MRGELRYEFGEFRTDSVRFVISDAASAKL
jgi:hypothetical protein